MKVNIPPRSIPRLKLKARVGNFGGTGKVGLILKVSNQNNPTVTTHFTPPFNASPQKQMTSLQALALGLANLVEDSGHPQ